MAFIENRIETISDDIYGQFDEDTSCTEHDNYEAHRFPEIRDDGLTDDEWLSLAYTELDEESEAALYDEQWRFDFEVEPPMPSFSGSNRICLREHPEEEYKDSFCKGRDHGQKRAKRWHKRGSSKKACLRQARRSVRTDMLARSLDPAYDSQQYLIDHFAARQKAVQREWLEEQADVFYSTETLPSYEN